MVCLDPSRTGMRGPRFSLVPMPPGGFLYPGPIDGGEYTHPDRIQTRLWQEDPRAPWSPAGGARASSAPRRQLMCHQHPVQQLPDAWTEILAPCTGQFSDVSITAQMRAKLLWSGLRGQSGLWRNVAGSAVEELEQIRDALLRSFSGRGSCSPCPADCRGGERNIGSVCGVVPSGTARRARAPPHTTKEQSVQIGFTLPQIGPLAHHAQEISRFAREAEGLGADSLWVGDRLLAPVEPTVGYGGGDSIPEVFHSVLDPFALMAVAASATENAHIGANILNGPWYAPAILSRSLTTIDQISGGRLMPGFGTGWSPEEYRAAGVPMEERGTRLDECLDALDALWTTNPAQYEGKHWSVPAAHVDVKPAQKPRPPVHLAGFATVAIRRVARRADGWLPVHVPGRGEFDPDSINAPMETIRGLAEQVGRDPAELGMVLRLYPTPAASLDQVVDSIVRAGRETDVDHVFVEMMNIAEDVDQALDQAQSVLAAVRG